MADILETCPESLDIDARIYVTKPQDLPELVLTQTSSSFSSDPSTPISEKKSIKEEKLFMKTAQGRPDVATLLEEEISCSSGAVSVDGG